MRRLLTLCLLAAVALSVSAQVRFLEDVHNFGAFSESLGEVKCDMKFVNESREPVIITQVLVTCGCTSPSYDKSPIEPGDTGVVTLAYDAHGRPGRFEKKVYVELNTYPSRYTLYIKGSVIGLPATINERYPAKMGPLRFLSESVPFGEVTKGKSKTYFVEAYNESADTLTPLWSNLPDFISVGVPRDTVYPGENISYTLIAASDKIKEYGLTIDTLTIIPDSRHPAEHYPLALMVMVNEDFSKMLPGQMRKAPVISASKSSLNFGSIFRGDGPVTKTFEIGNDGNNTLVIRRVYSADPGVSASVSTSKVKKGKESEVTVTVNPEEITGNVINARVVVISNDPLEPVLNIRIVGEIKP